MLMRPELFSFIVYFPFAASAQLPPDTTSYARTINLPEVVVTGQYEPQSAENSVFRVKVIDKADLQARGAASLNEALFNELNIRLSQDLAIGNASLSLQGISGNNVKVLIDGVPLVGRNGNGVDVDLYQVDLNQIEKIEIVEGPMAVSYGANALAGVVNLVTQKSTDANESAAISVSMTEETAGNEYGLSKGKHMQHLAIRHNFSKNLVTQFKLSRNDFNGFQGAFTGRQKEWNPKEQWFLSGTGQYKFNPAHKISYSINYLDEMIEDPGQTRFDISETGRKTPYAFDEEYHTRRLDQRLQSNGKLNHGLRYNLIFSYANYKRLKSRYSHNLIDESRTYTIAEGDQDSSVFNALALRGSLIKTFGSELSQETGYDINREWASGGRISGKDQSINDYGFLQPRNGRR